MLIINMLTLIKLTIQVSHQDVTQDEIFPLCFACTGHLIGYSYSSVANQLKHHNWEDINVGNCE